MGIIEGSNYEGRGLMKGNLGSEKTKMPDRLLPNLMMLCPLNPKINIGIYDALLPRYLKKVKHNSILKIILLLSLLRQDLCSVNCQSA